MNRLPIVKPDEVLRRLRRAGFETSSWTSGPEMWSSREKGVALPVGILPAEAAVVEDDRLTTEVISETPARQGQPVLALTGSDPFQLFDMVGAGTVVRIGPEDMEDFVEAIEEVGMVLHEGFEQAIEAGSGANGKGWHHIS